MALLVLTKYIPGQKTQCLSSLHSTSEAGVINTADFPSLLCA